MTQDSPLRTPHSALKELPPLMPQFLRKRRVGMAGLRELIEELGLEPPLFHTLRLLHEIQGSYGGEPISLENVRSRSRYIYSTKDLLTAPIATLKEKGLLVEADYDSFSLSSRAR